MGLAFLHTFSMFAQCTAQEDRDHVPPGGLDFPKSGIQL